MKFFDALREALTHPSEYVKISRPNGPELILDPMGQIHDEVMLKTHSSNIYAGDLLDLDDWEVSERIEP